MDEKDPQGNRRNKALRRVYEEVTTYGEGGRGDVMEEISQLEELLARQPENLDIQEWLAFKYYSINQFEKALEIYRRLLGAGHRPGVQHFYLGNTYYKLEDTDRAIESWQKTIEMIPTDSKAEKARARIDRVRRKLSMEPDATV